VLSEFFPCPIVDFPCRYLGVPLSVRRLKKSDKQYLIDAVAAQIWGWKGNMLNEAGRTTLVKPTLSAIPMHLSIVVCLSSWTIEAIDRRRRAFLWSGRDTVAAGRCWVAWPTVCRPRELGGLGVADLRMIGIAFQVRWQWLDRTAPNSCWAGLPANHEKAVAAVSQATTFSVLGDGESTLFWHDRWISGRSIEELAPALFAAERDAGHPRYVAQALHQRAWGFETLPGL